MWQPCSHAETCNDGIMNKEQSFDAVVEEDIEDKKAALRAKVRACRKKLTSQARKEAAKNILDAAAPVLEREDETIASYVPVNAEPDVMGIANEAFRQGKEVLLPRLGPKLSRTWALYRGPGDLQVHAPGRPPAPSGEILSPDVISRAGLLILPAFSIDRSGNRLGQGGGWYDHILENASADACICAVVYTSEFLDAENALPIAPHDKKVNAVLTPAGFLYLN